MEKRINTGVLQDKGSVIEADSVSCSRQRVPIDLTVKALYTWKPHLERVTAQHAQGVCAMLVQCWPIVYDGGQHCTNIGQTYCMVGQRLFRDA